MLDMLNALCVFCMDVSWWVTQEKLNSLAGTCDQTKHNKTGGAGRQVVGGEAWRGVCGCVFVHTNPKTLESKSKLLAPQ